MSSVCWPPVCPAPATAYCSGRSRDTKEERTDEHMRRSHGEETMTAGAPVPFLQLTGEPYELGRQHGGARAAELRAFLDDGLTRLNHLLDTPVSLASLE